AVCRLRAHPLEPAFLYANLPPSWREASPCPRGLVMDNWVELKPPPAVGDVIRFSEPVRGSRGRSIGLRTLDAKVIQITGDCGRDDSLTLVVVAEGGIVGAPSLVAGSCVAAPTSTGRTARSGWAPDGRRAGTQRVVRASCYRRTARMRTHQVVHARRQWTNM